MKKRLGALSTLFLLCTTVVLWTGCSSANYDYDNCCDVEQSCPVNTGEEESAEGQVCPAQCCEPLCKKPAKCCYPRSSSLKCCDGITVKATQPDMCMLGDQSVLDIEVSACKDVCDAFVRAELPENVQYVKGSPEAKVDGKMLTWNLGKMHKGESMCIRVTLKCDCEGEVCVCFCAGAVPVAFCASICAKPILVCEKCGPEEVSPCDPVNYTITVTNRGSCTARDVVVTDHVPEQLEHASGQKSIVCKLGDLEPCQSKKVKLCFTAVKRGKACNTAVVTACNADTTSCQVCTNISKCLVDVTKTGPKEVMVGSNADYQITVTNTGDKTLTDVVVTDCAPTATDIVAASGATINGHQAVWRVKQMKPGEKATFNITLYSCTPGCFTNRVSVDNCQRCTDCAQFTTRWKGRPALDVSVCDTEDFICVGDHTTYVVNLNNRGTEPDNNVVITLKFPEEMQPLNASGPSEGKVMGQMVRFAPINNFAARQTAEFRVEAQAKKAGDARVNVEVTSDSLKTPLTQQESTIIN
ncbi:MAG: DUF11 domain-containing protein [Chlamydiia bacterium]|nr:DUF11 domain-containing protein [Chlamydiia bacterium]